MALRNLKRRGDLERTGLLIESLSRHWRDTVPLELLIVAPSRDVPLLRTSLPRHPGIEVSVRSESEFFPPLSRFYMMTGWYRQQMVKLQVPVMLGFGGYLTLDSDVCCVGDFDATTFVADGKALSRWEPKRYHDWWRQAADIVGTGFDIKAHGLSVTPNILHGDLARQTLEFFRRGPIDPMSTLGLWILRKIGNIAWTEYSLYTCVGELKGNLLDYHVHWDPCYFQDIQLFSEHASVWGADDFERLVNQQGGGNPRGKFIIVQSHARIPLERVRDYCLSFAS
ncbi:MAG: hypothetical protein KIT25_07270 [Enhydrobacter sp.]|nr:MAG: hypothetical protein KIT25_07270 [Enhydrobacter sp.]